MQQVRLKANLFLGRKGRNHTALSCPFLKIDLNAQGIY
jgi:hypothetical protein